MASKPSIILFWQSNLQNTAFKNIKKKSNIDFNIWEEMRTDNDQHRKQISLKLRNFKNGDNVNKEKWKNKLQSSTVAKSKTGCYKFLKTWNYTAIDDNQHKTSI